MFSTRHNKFVRIFTSHQTWLFNFYSHNSSSSTGGDHASLRIRVNTRRRFSVECCIRREPYVMDSGTAWMIWQTFPSRQSMSSEMWNGTDTASIYHLLWQFTYIWMSFQFKQTHRTPKQLLSSDRSCHAADIIAMQQQTVNDRLEHAISERSIFICSNICAARTMQRFSTSCYSLATVTDLSTTPIHGANSIRFTKFCLCLGREPARSIGTTVVTRLIKLYTVKK